MATATAMAYEGLRLKALGSWLMAHGLVWLMAYGLWLMVYYYYGLWPVGTLPDGYVRTNPLPQVPTRQSAPITAARLPSYFRLPVVIPTLRRLLGPTIARVRIPS
jgi:hypothetical protein